MLVWQDAVTSCQHCARAPLIGPAKNPSVYFQVYVGMDAIMATPAMSALIRGRKLYGEHIAAFLPHMTCRAVSSSGTTVAGRMYAGETAADLAQLQWHASSIQVASL